LGILTGVIVHVLQHVRDRSLTLGVNAAGKLANKTDLLVVTKPLGSRDKTLGTNGGGNTERRGARAIGVEVPESCQHSSCSVGVLGALLVHLVNKFVLRVGERPHQVTMEMVSFKHLVGLCSPPR